MEQSQREAAMKPKRRIEIDRGSRPVGARPAGRRSAKKVRPEDERVAALVRLYADLYGA
jgi:hypothetical protein